MTTDPKNIKSDTYPKKWLISQKKKEEILKIDNDMMQKIKKIIDKKD